MRYVSTRGHSPPQSFDDILLAGVASDGGLFMPEAWPQIGAEEIAGYAQAPYGDVAFAILRRFVAGSFSDEELRADIDAAYGAFDLPEVVHLVPAGSPGEFKLLELFHGPTLAFKDIAMQLLGHLFARALARRGTRAAVVVATSGDTGSAAIAALGGLANIELFVLHPNGRVSEVQRRQMTTSAAANVHNIALEGTFDDAQSIVKALFADTAFARSAHLTAVNSINFARIAAQSVYYFKAAAKLGQPATFVVPTGNFGDVFAGEAAARMGLPVTRLVIATNENDILARAIDDGVYAPLAVHHTLSPSMDIQVASNFERALFEASGRDAGWLTKAMEAFSATRRLAIPAPVLSALRARYRACRTNDSQTLEAMRSMHAQTGRFIDPHTAVALAAAHSMTDRAAGPIVVLSTADPGKFPEAVKRATGEFPPLPPHLSGLYDVEERVTILPNDKATIRSFIQTILAHP